MAITLNGTTGITTPAIDSTAGFDATDLTGDVAAARITDALNASGSAPIYAARAWVNFNGTGTVAIRAAGNVSSITDNAAGDYTVNFTNPLSSADYSVVGSAGTSSSAVITLFRTAAGTNTTTSPTVNGFKFLVMNSGTTTAFDQSFVSVAVFG